MVIEGVSKAAVESAHYIEQLSCPGRLTPQEEIDGDTRPLQQEQPRDDVESDRVATAELLGKQCSPCKAPVQEEASCRSVGIGAHPPVEDDALRIVDDGESGAE